MKQCVDSENLHRRLKKIIGQVQAIDRMVDEGVLSQINAAKSALNGCGKVVLEGQIKHCVRTRRRGKDYRELHQSRGTLRQYAITFCKCVRRGAF